MNAPDNVATAVFGIPSLRDAQREAVHAAQAGHDVLVRLPTGAGKSLCFQIPAILDARAGRGMTVVVSPLVALMDNQVAALQRAEVPAVALHSNLDTPARHAALAAMKSGVTLFYASPERLKSKRLRAQLAQRGVARLVIDEAHCISEWGHDFRPEYRTLAELRAALDVPLMALTATATTRVAGDIRDNLAMEHVVDVHRTVVRPNLQMRVELIKGGKTRIDRVREWVASAAGDGRTIVYVKTRKQARKVSDALRRAKIRSDWYHAGRTPAVRRRVIDAYERGDRPVIVATSAFGMGMDRPDVRLVVHAQAPTGIEAYLQQAGRAGRDGAPATCVLLWSAQDALMQKRLGADRPAQLASWNALQDYALGNRCRWQQLGAAFDDAVAACGSCDVCMDPRHVQDGIERYRAARAAASRERRAERSAEDATVLDNAQREHIVAFVDALKRPVGKRLAALGLRGSKAKAARRRGVPDNPHHGALKGVPERAIIRTIEELLADGRLAPRGKKYPTVWMPNKPVRTASTKPRGPKKARSPLERALRNLRTRAARKRRWKPYQVFPDATLNAILAVRPTTLDELAEIPGIGPSRITKFGADILSTVREHPS